MGLIEKILNLENISVNNLTKSTSGFTNQVYFTDNYVIKFANDIRNKEKLEKEISIYKNINLKNIPKYISSGEIEDSKYIIISRLKGVPLYSIWHTLERNTQIDIIKQIANILKNFHKLDYHFLDKKYIFSNWEGHISSELHSRIKELTNLGFNTDKLKFFIDHSCPLLFKNNTFGLVYNDAHFDNFLLCGKNIYLIDFDRVIYAPLDYEMLIFKTMCDIPDKFASEDDYLNCKIEDYKYIYAVFKNFYPKLFDNLNETRIEIYQFNYLIAQAIKCKDNKRIKQLLTQFHFD